MHDELDVACHVNVLVTDAEPVALGAALATLGGIGYRRAVLPPLDPATVDADRLNGVFRDHGLGPITIAGQAPDADVSSANPDVRAAGLASLRASLALTVALGGDQMNGVPYAVFGHPTQPTSREAFERAAEAVGQVADEAHERGVMMTFEVLNRYETSLVNTARQAMDFVEASGSDHLRIHLDTFHMAVEEGSISEAIRTALPRLGYLELGQSGRGSLAHGAVDIPAIVQQARTDGYAGRWGVEAFSRPVLLPFVADMLAIWRTPYTDGVDLATEAWALITGADR